MEKKRSYFSRPYAPAWGLLIGTVVGVPVGAASSLPWLIGVFALVGLVIGSAISLTGK